MNEYIEALRLEFEAYANPKTAAEQRAYLRDQFLFYGIKTPVRRAMQKPFLVKEYLPPKETLDDLVRHLWKRPQREYHYFAQELVQKYTKQFEKNDIQLLEFMVMDNSWWDTVDFIAPKLIGEYFRKFPDRRDSYVKKMAGIEQYLVATLVCHFSITRQRKPRQGVFGACDQLSFGVKRIFYQQGHRVGPAGL